MSEEFKKSVLENLVDSDRDIHFCCSGDISIISPKLSVGGQSAFQLPISKMTAEKIITYARQAPFGKGEGTFVDTRVRNVWELLPDQFELRNPEWDAVVHKIVDHVRHSMRLKDSDVSAHLYRLLVYEKGGFFLPHRDGEKMDRMVATLVITLPCKHSGGELIVRHEGKEVILDTERAATKRGINFTAFYADCEHEVKPVSSGHRVSLVYNLVANPIAHTSKRNSLISSIESTDSACQSETLALEGLASVFAHWPKEITKAVIVLDHRYTSRGVSAELLKGTDREKAKQIFDAARQANCACYLTLLTRAEKGDADYYETIGEKFYSRDTEWDEEGRSGKRNVKPMPMNELYEHSTTVDGWIDSSGTRASLGVAKVEPREIISTADWDSLTPSREEVSGYLGNEGLTIDRWYHRAAMVVWPAGADLQLLCDRGLSIGLSELQKWITLIGKSSAAKQEVLRDEACELAGIIVQRWAVQKADAPDLLKQDIFAELDQLDAAEIAAEYMSTVLTKHDHPCNAPNLVEFGQRYGWEQLEIGLQEWFKNSTPHTIFRDLDFAIVFHEEMKRAKAPADIAETLVELLTAQVCDRIAPSHEFTTNWGSEKIRVKLSVRVFQALISTRSSNGLRAWVSFLQQQEARYPIRTLQYGLLSEIVENALSLGNNKSDVDQSSLTEIRRWIDALIAFFESATISEPQAPIDWTRESKIFCTCANCAEVNRFLLSSTQPMYRFRSLKTDREHVESHLRLAEADVNCTTDRAGSPQTLIIAKTDASYQKKLVVYHEDQQKLTATIKAKKVLCQMN